MKYLKLFEAKNTWNTINKDEIKTLKQFRNQLIGIGNNMFNVANPQHSGGNATEWTHMREELSEFY